MEAAASCVCWDQERSDVTRWPALETPEVGSAKDTTSATIYIHTQKGSITGSPARITKQSRGNKQALWHVSIQMQQQEFRSKQDSATAGVYRHCHSHYGAASAQSIDVAMHQTGLELFSRVPLENCFLDLLLQVSGLFRVDWSPCSLPTCKGARK